MKPDVAAPPAECTVKGDEHEVDIDLLLARLRGRRRRIAVHVGAHAGEEAPSYFASGFAQVILVEANPEACATMRERFADERRVTVIEAAAVAAAGPLTLHLHTSRRGSVEAASVLAMKELRRIVATMHTPRELAVRGKRLDTLLREAGIAPERCDLLNVDVQGAELLVFAGAPDTLAACRWVIAEVNKLELYEGGALEHEVDDFLRARRFDRDYTVYHRYYDENGWFVAWGEALYCRRGPAGRAGARRR